MSKRTSRLYLLPGAEPARTLVETLLMAPLFWLFLLWLDFESPTFPINLFTQGSVFMIPGCALYAALRLRPLEAPWSQQVPRVVPIVAGLSIGLPALLMAVFTLARLMAPGEVVTIYIADGMRFLLISAVLSGPFFFFLWLGRQVWRFWDRLRRTHLVWSLTHAHLVLVATLSLIFATFLALLTVDSYTGFAGGGLSGRLVDIVARLFAWLLPILSLLTIITVVVMALVLPASAAFSYIVSRGTNRRLAGLTRAADALRAGDYGVRVDVEGEDEVARLQEGFNAMSSELQTAMRELRAERDTVAALSQQRRELVAGVSHDLRTPVATLRGYIESSLNSRTETVPLDVRQDLEVMEREVVRLQSLIDDLFLVARAEAGNLTLRIEPVDTARLVRRIADTAAPLVWQSSKVQVIAEAPPSLPPAAADPGRLEQVLGNLLHNAVRHTPAGGLVGLIVSATPSNVLIQVRDTGEGIAEEDLQRIWERFYRAGGAGSPDNGAGLGLTLVKELTEAMGGSVLVESKVGEGSCFTVSLQRA